MVKKHAGQYGCMSLHVSENAQTRRHKCCIWRIQNDELAATTEQRRTPLMLWSFCIDVMPKQRIDLVRVLGAGRDGKLFGDRHRQLQHAVLSAVRGR